MARNAVTKLARKAPKVIFEAATGHKLNVSKLKHKKKKKNSSYVVDDDSIKLMRKQLTNVGCKLQEVEADGNCLFRALGDQLYGDQHRHEDIRERLVKYLEQHRADFEPFMEDEEKFEKYCERMREDGTWGGNQELYAAARLFQVYVVVHQDQPSARIMVIECDRLKPTRFVHVAYHGEDHYDSVRSLRDPVEFNKLPVSIELNCEGFRPEDFAKRWQTSIPTPTAADLVDLPTDRVDGMVDHLTGQLGEQLKVEVDSCDGADGKTLSKKEQRQLRKAEKAAKTAARKQRSAPK